MWEVMIRGSDVGNAHPRVLLLLSKAKEALKEEREMLKQPLWEHWKSGEFGAWDLILFDQSSFLLASVYFEEGGGLVVRFSRPTVTVSMDTSFSWLH